MLGSNYNYAVLVDDGNLVAGKSSYDIFKYSYIGASRDKTILLSKLTDESSNHTLTVNNDDFLFKGIGKLQQ